MKAATVTLLAFTLLGPISLNAEPYSDYQIGPVCYPSGPMRYPGSTEEVVAIVHEAILKGFTIKANGARHSITDVICTDGIPIDMGHFQKKEMNPDGSATFGAGVIMWDVGGFLSSNGRALRTAPQFGNITIAGAAGTGAHGTSLKYDSTLSDQIIGVTIVDGLGNVREITDDNDLRAFRIHLGLLGIILDITVKTVPFYKVLAHNYEISEDILFDGRAEQYAREIDMPMMLWYPLLSKVLIFNHTIVGPDVEGDAYGSFAASFSYEENTELNNNIEALQRLSSADAAAAVNASQSEGYKAFITDGFVSKNPVYSEDQQTVKNPAVGDWQHLASSICAKEGPIKCQFIPEMGDAQTKVLESEIAISITKLPQMAQKLRDIIAIAPAAFMPSGIVFRFSRSSDTYMSVSEGRDTVHVGFYRYKRQNEYDHAMSWLAAYQTFSQVLVHELDGRAHWGKSGSIYHSAEMITRKLNPVAKQAFLSEMSVFDPRGIFLNNFGRRFLGTGDKHDIDPRTIHCAILDNCVCSNNYHCSDTQICRKIGDSYNYNVCNEN